MTREELIQKLLDDYKLELNQLLTPELEAMYNEMAKLKAMSDEGWRAALGL